MISIYSCELSNIQLRAAESKVISAKMNGSYIELNILL